MSTPMTYETALMRLTSIGQEHVLKFYAELAPDQQQALLAQISGLDLEALPSLVREYVINKPAFELPKELMPAPYFAADGLGWDREGARAAGEQLLREGKVAAFTVAGGQGSRLGYEGPKGCYPAGAVTKKPLFEMFADALAATGEKYGKPVAWYIMTSPLNHEATVAYFEERGYFGLNAADVKFFRQGVMASMDIRTGKMLMASKWEIATNPDGHGGSLRGLWESGSIADMKARGIEHISYFQVDNPIVKVADPVFLGLHVGGSNEGDGDVPRVGGRSSREMSSKMIPKAYAEEKLGLFCRVGDRIEVIEYSDLPKEIASERLPDGRLHYLAGSIAVHVISVAFVERLNTDAAFQMPYHRAEKKVACIDIETGQPAALSGNNAVKLERFVFDALSLCRGENGMPGSIVYETDRIEEFAPIKNATGVDSAESCREIQTERAARWIEAAGVTVARRVTDGKPDCVLEINPRTALEAADLKRSELPRKIVAGDEKVI